MSFQSGSEPPQKRRFPRPNGKWTNPATPLQAARFELQITGKQLVNEIRKLCPGHSGEPCKLDVSKASDYETGNRRPGIEHIEAFCRYYQRSPEDLGLIKWRDKPAPQAGEQPGDATGQQTGETGSPGGPTPPNPQARDGEAGDAPGHRLMLVWIPDRLDSTTVATAVRILRILMFQSGP